MWLLGDEVVVSRKVAIISIKKLILAHIKQIFRFAKKESMLTKTLFRSLFYRCEFPRLKTRAGKNLAFSGELSFWANLHPRIKKIGEI